MLLLVLGIGGAAGFVVGFTTAAVLWCTGHRAVVVDRRDPASRTPTAPDNRPDLELLEQGRPSATVDYRPRLRRRGRAIHAHTSRQLTGGQS